MLAYHENIQTLKSKYEQQYNTKRSFEHLSQLIDIYLIDTKYKEAEKLLIEFKSKTLSTKEKGQYYLMLARTYKYQIKNDLSLINFQKSGEIFKKIGDKDCIINCKIELVEFYRKTRDYERAFKLIKDLLETDQIETLANEKLKNFFYHRYAAVLNEQAKLPESINYSKKAIASAKKINDVYAEAISYNELGYSYKNSSKIKASIENYNKAYEMWLLIGSYSDAVHAKLNNNLLLAHNELISFEEQIKVNKELLYLIDSLSIKYPTAVIYTAIEFPNIYLKKWEEAYKYRKKADSAALIEQEEANSKIVNELKEKYENDQLQEKNLTIQKISKERKEKLKLSETRFWWIFAFSIFVAILSTILYILWRKNKRQNKLLKEQNIQKTILIQEIHHRVKNNLQFVKSILSMQQSLSDLSAKETIDDIFRRIDAMSIVHEMLYVENENSEISVKDYIEKLISISKSFYKFEADIDFKLELDYVELSLEKLIALGVICSELLANSVKYAFVNNSNPQFAIYLKKNKDVVTLIVKDNGSSIVENKDDKRYKLGLRLIEIFARKLEAKMESDFSNGFQNKFTFQLNELSVE